MDIPKATLSSKKQITIPAEVCKKMHLAPSSKILFIEIRPGEFQLVAGQKGTSALGWAKNLSGKYRNDNVDAVQGLLNDRKKDLELEQRGYLQ